MPPVVTRELVELPRVPTRTRRGAGALFPPMVAFVVLLGGWELYVRVRNVKSLVLPAPSKIARAVLEDRSGWVAAAWVTGQEAFFGFLIALGVALALAVAATTTRSVERAVLPVVTVVQLIPVVALAPALVIGLGFGMWPRVLVAGLIAFAPLTVNAIAGMQAVDADALELLRSVDASRWEILVRLRLPHSVPYLVAAARVCVGLALIGAMVAEWQGSSAGLGYTFSRAQRTLATERMWAAVFVLAIMGVAALGGIALLERRLLRWRPGRLRN
ncbi:MAG: ABC transporter permease [Acidimicrobiales bacterium]